MNEKYPAEQSSNKLIADLKLRMESDVQVSAHQLVSSQPATEKEQVEEFQRVFSDLIGVQRKELRRFRTKDGFDEEVIRKHEMQMDLEEERVKHRFESFTGKEG